MKYLLVILIIFFGCATKGNFSSTHNTQQVDNFFDVLKIDSVGNYYVIYAKRQKSWYKIISKKVMNDNECKKIVVGKIYDISVHSILEVNGKLVIPENQLYEISDWKIDNSTRISFEGDSIRNIYLSKDLEGLCLKKK